MKHSVARRQRYGSDLPEPSRYICVAHAHLLSISADTVMAFNHPEPAAGRTIAHAAKRTQYLSIKSLACNIEAHPVIFIEDTARTQPPDDRRLRQQGSQITWFGRGIG
jgi:hypothetical protein